MSTKLIDWQWLWDNIFIEIFLLNYISRENIYLITNSWQHLKNK